MPPNTHAILSPSSAARWLHCTRSARLELKFSEKESDAATEGTAAHALCEHKVKKALKQRSRRPVSEYDSDEMEELTDAGEGDFCSGDWCLFCKAAVKCRARAQAKLELAKQEFSLPPILTDEEIEDILPRIPDITKWANDIMTYATDAALNHGKQWKGFKVVEGRSNRKYSDEDAVIKAARDAGYTDIFKTSLITLTEMEKLMGKKKFKDILGGLVVKPQGKPTLVPETDRRTAIIGNDVKSDFKKITEVM